MEANKILSADILDILFDGRNKDYGAYELRKTYNRRLLLSIAGMAGIVLLFFLIYFLANSATQNGPGKLVVKDVELVEIKKAKEIEPVQLPESPKLKPRKVETVR